MLTLGMLAQTGFPWIVLPLLDHFKPRSRRPGPELLGSKLSFRLLASSLQSSLFSLPGKSDRDQQLWYRVSCEPCMSFLRSFEPSRLVLQLSEPSDGGLAFSQTLLLKKKCHFIIVRTVVHTGLRIESWLGPMSCA